MKDNPAPRDLQIDWLRAFAAVVDAGSLSAAAPLVHRSQSAVSSQLQKLEEALGRPVLRRGPRHLSLTPAGQELLGYARKMLELQAEALRALQDRPLAGRVRMGVPDDYAASYLTPVLRQFAGRHGGVEIELVCEQSTALIPRIGRGELDLALVSRDRASRGTLLFLEPLVWVGAPAHEAWRRDPLPVAAYEAGSQARSGALEALRTAGRSYRVVYDSASMAGQLAAVDSGLAVAALTRCCVPPGLQILGERQGLPPLPAMEVALLRRRGTGRDAAVD
uniref:LysR substrate-binding domain-containing protein n=1 Tax=Pelomonas sp. KK5 TaxID=1855730 RepID=UPI0009F90122